ncbi:alpha/beta fold hydrolase [Faunimonas sp. B44]|uniref:alpha/beta fold hydrolase n=1 Tax=Faunimonas sp. B44 TaxID=3461493 RepID=UPI00404437C3
MIDLVDIPSNPVPDGAVAGMVPAPDGPHLRYARWPLAVHPGRGTVILLQGRAEFIEKYFETVRDLRRRGFAVATFDWRGQGGSDRLLADPRKGHVRGFETYVSDLMTVMRNVVLADCPPPYYVLAHSTGGAVALLAAERLRTQVDRMVLTAPLVALRGPRGVPPGLVRNLARLGFAHSYIPGGGATILATRPFRGNPVTSDRERYLRTNAVIEGDLRIGVGSATIGWAAAAIRASQRFARPRFAERVPIPVLMVIAGADRVVSNSAIETLASRIGTAAHVWIPGSLHEILMERDLYRDQFWAAFDQFVR